MPPVIPIIPLLLIITTTSGLACEAPSIMPATCTSLLHQLSLLLLVGPHLFVGSLPLDADSPSSSSPPLSSSSSSSSTDRARFATAGAAAPSTPEDSSFAAASLLLPSEGKSRAPSAALSRVWATQGRSTISSPPIMSKQKAGESSRTESRMSSSATDHPDAFSTFDNGEGRTLGLITDRVSVPTAARGRTASYPETAPSGDLIQDSPLVMQSRRADAPSSTLDIAELETVPLMTQSLHSTVASLSEPNFPATGSSHHRDSSWDLESMTFGLQTEGMDSSASTANKERTSRFLTDSVTLIDSAPKDPVSQTEFPVSSEQTQFPSQATQSRERSTTSNILHFPDSSARTLLNHSYLSLNTAAEGADQRRSNASTKQSIFSSQTDSLPVLGVSDRSGGRTLQPLTDISHSHNATQTSLSSSNEISSSLSHTHSSYMLTPEQTAGMDLSLQDTDFTEETFVHSQTHLETTAAEGADQRRSNASTKQSIFSSQTDSLPVLGVSDRSGGRTLQPLTDISHSHNATQTSLSSSNEISSSLSHSRSSYVLTPEQTAGMDLSLQDTDFTKETFVHSQTHLETTAAEGADQRRSNASTKQSIFSSQTDSLPVLGVSVRSGGRTLQPLTDISHSHNATQTSLSSSNEISSSLSHSRSSYVLTPEQTAGMDLSLQDTDFTEETSVHSQTHLETTAAEGADQRRSNASTKQSIFSSQTDSLPVLGVSVRSGGRTLQPLTDISHSHNATQTSLSSSNEISSSLSHSRSSYVLTPEQTAGMDLSLQDTDFTEETFVHSQTHLETTEDRNSRHTSSVEKRATHTQTDSTFSSATLFRDRVETLEAINNRSNSTEATEISAFGLEDVSSDFTWTSSVAVESRRNQILTTEEDFTESSEEHLLTLSSKTSFHLPYTRDVSKFRTKPHTFSTSSMEKTNTQTQTESTFSLGVSIRDGNQTLESLTNASNFTEATLLSTFDLEGVNSSDLTQSSSVTVESGRNPVSSEEEHFTDTSEEPLLTYSSKTSIYPPSTIDISSPGKSDQPVKVSDPQGRISKASTDSVYLSTTFMHGAERTLRSLPDNSTFDAAENSTSHTEASSSSNPTLTSVAEAKENNVSLSEGQFTEHSTERLLEHSSLVPVYSSSPEDPSTTGSGQKRASSSGTETRASRSYTDTYSSAPFSRGEEQTLQSVMNTTLPEVTESSSSYMEKSSASELNSSLSGTYSEMTDVSGKDFDISGPSTETVQSFTSSRMPTYSSLQTEPSDTGNDFRTIDSTDTGTRSSASHTDSTHISVTKDGERTLPSISNNSTSFYAEISTPSESAQTSFSMTQNIGSDLSSSDRDFSAPSTEPLAVQTLQTGGYSSTVSYPVSPSSSSSNLSFPSSSPASSLQYSLPPTQPPPSFSSSESPQPALYSAFPTQLSSQTSSLTPSPSLSSTALPTFPPSSPSLPPSASSSLEPSIDVETSVSITAYEGTTGTDSSTAGSSTSEYNPQTKLDLLKDSTGLSSTGSSLLQTEATEQLTNHSAPVTISLGTSNSTRDQNVSLPGTVVEKSIPILTTSPIYLSESTTVSGTTKGSPSVLSKTTTQTDVFSLVYVTTGKNLTDTTHTMLGLPTSASTTGYAETAKSPKVQSPSSTKMSHTFGMTTKGIETSSAPTVKVIYHHVSTTHPPKIFPSSKPTSRPLSTSPVPTKPTTVARLGSPNTFTTSHGKEIDACLSNPCPALATCANTQGSFQCTCSLGYQMEKGKCNLVRTFVGRFPLTFNTTGGKYSELHHIEEDLIQTLNNSLSTLPGYYTSTVQASRLSGTIQVSVVSTFSVASNVTLYDIVSTVRNYIHACKASSETCRFMSSLSQLHRAGGLCKHKDPECDRETSACLDFDGIADCQCKPGYFRYNKLDHSCRACEDGYKLENDTCVSCPFGLGGFNCGNPYQLITIVIAAAGGGLLLILGIALIITCCQKNKNDISKLIFKSGDFQMSPYAEYPKNPRAQDWGRETIEMQENGSTKNLLQMTDVYYMPTNVRNTELERNGLYPPYTGLPGSRHSCIYPGQYNPSFVSDDSRRRDYF